MPSLTALSSHNSVFLTNQLQYLINKIMSNSAESSLQQFIADIRPPENIRSQVDIGYT